jgi:hypothetical protein
MGTTLKRDGDQSVNRQQATCFTSTIHESRLRYIENEPFIPDRCAVERAKPTRRSLRNDRLLWRQQSGELTIDLVGSMMMLA